MAARIAFRHAVKRDEQLPAAPTAIGVGGASTARGTLAPQATGLVFDTGSPDFSQTAPPLANVPLTPSTPADPSTSTPTPSSDVSGSEASASTSDTKVIPMSLVVGACLGAVAGALILILFGWFIYKRTAPKRKARQPHGSVSASRNARGEMARTRSRMENWDKLDDGEDKWETKEVPDGDAVGPMEKLTMFKKSTPSVRTAYTYKSEAPPVFDLGAPHPFAQPHLVTDAPKASGDQPPSLGRVDAGPALSWESEGLGAGSFLTLHSRLSGAMSPTTTVALPTPNVTSSEPHHWESAEVLNYDEAAIEEKSNNPFNEDNRRSAHNPFFNAKFSMPAKPSPAKMKGKEPQRTQTNPFDDTAIPSIPQINHVPHSSVSSNDRALQNLIAALDLSEEEVQERLRVASMQPSILSATSIYTNDLEEVTQFPLPPGAANDHTP